MSEESSFFARISISKENYEKFLQSKPIAPKRFSDWQEWFNTKQMYGDGIVDDQYLAPYDDLTVAENIENWKASKGSFALSEYDEKENVWRFSILFFQENYGLMMPQLAVLRGIEKFKNNCDDDFIVVLPFFFASGKPNAFIQFKDGKSTFKLTMSEKAAIETARYLEKSVEKIPHHWDNDELDDKHGEVSSYPGKVGSFPFFGADIGSYYNACEMSIKFKNAPTKNDIARINKTAPKPLRIRNKIANLEVSGTTLWLCSKQMVTKHIAREYGVKGERYRHFEEGYFCSKKALVAFESVIEDWLISINEYCPIEFALRPRDFKRGGSVPSVWHEESCKKLPELSKTWLARSDSAYEGDERQIFAYMLIGLTKLGLELPDELLARFIPEIKRNTLFKTDRNEMLIGLTNLAHQRMDEERWHIPIAIYDRLLYLLDGVGVEDYGIGKCSHSLYYYAIYANALYVREQHNTGFPVDPERNKKVLSFCLPVANKNPTIYYNAACLYVEMNQFNKALSCLKKYFRSKDVAKKSVARTLKKDKEFKEFRKYEGVAELLKTI